MNVEDALKVESLIDTKVVAAADSLDRVIRWAHVVEIPDPRRAAQPGLLLLTTGLSWPTESSALRNLIEVFIERQVAAVGLATGEYVTHFSPGMVEAADAAHVPLLEIPWSVRFAQVTEEVNTSIIAEQLQIIREADVLHRRMVEAASSAESLQDLAATVAHLTGNSILIEDMNRNVLGGINVGYTDAFQIEALETGRSPQALSDHLKDHGYWDRIMARGAGACHVPAFPELGSMRRIYSVIRVRGESVGLLQIIEHYESELILRIAEQTAMISALQIVNERRLAMQEARLGNDFVTSILDGHLDETNVAPQRMSIWGLDRGTKYQVVIGRLGDDVSVSLDDATSRDAIVDDFRTKFCGSKNSPLALGRLNQVILVVPAQKSHFHAILEFLTTQGLAIVGGRPYRGLSGIRRSYLEASGMLPYAKVGTFASYESLLIPRVFLGDPEARSALVSELLAPIQQARGGDELVQTLLMFVERGFHYKLVAEQSHMHLNTLRNRIARACNLGGIDINNDETRFKLQMAARLSKLPQPIRSPAQLERPFRDGSSSTAHAGDAPASTDNGGEGRSPPSDRSFEQCPDCSGPSCRLGIYSAM